MFFDFLCEYMPPEYLNSIFKVDFDSIQSRVTVILYVKNSILNLRLEEMMGFKYFDSLADVVVNIDEAENVSDVMLLL